MPRIDQPRKIKICDVCQRLFAASEKFKTCSSVCTKERVKIKRREYWHSDIEKHRKMCRDYYWENKKERSVYNKKYSIDNSEKLKANQKRRRQENPKKYKDSFKKWYAKYPEQNKARARSYRDRNPEKVRKAFRKWQKAKLANCPKYKMLHTMRTRMVDVMRKVKARKHTNTIALLGCSLDVFVAHMESLFTEGMTWKNHGRYGWHVDHIKPCASFNMLIPEHQSQCFHYTNLQPLWAADNAKKGSKYYGD